MPKPTLTETVQRLERSVTILEEQIKGIRQCDELGRRHTDDIVRLTVEHAVLREKISAIEKTTEQVTQRRWTLFVAILSAFLGGFLTLLIQWSLRAFPK